MRLLSNGNSSQNGNSVDSWHKMSGNGCSVAPAVAAAAAVTDPQPASSPDDDDDTEKDGDPPLPDLLWEDSELQSQLLVSLSHMRKNRHFCDVILQIGKQDLYAHRAVLAAASPYLMDLFSGEKGKPTRKEVETANGIVYQLDDAFQKDALEILIEYAYTARLFMPATQAKSVYVAAVRLRMDRVAGQCAEFLCSNLGLDNCLELRSLPGVSRRAEIVREVDAFIEQNVERLCLSATQSGAIASMDKICVEVLHGSKEEMELAQDRSLCQLVLDWIHGQWLEDERLSLQALKGKKHLLFLDKGNSLEDCQSIEEGSAKDSEIIQDYKKNNQHHQLSKQEKKIRRHSNMKPARPRELLYSRHINQEDMKTEDHVEDWKVIACTTLEGGSSILAFITIDGHLFTCSIIQRVNRPSSPSFTTASNSASGIASASDSEETRESKSKSPSLSRPPSQDKDLYLPVAIMNQAKCGAGAGCLDGKLIVCGGFDRGECLTTVCSYTPSSNTWEELAPMQEKRGRFDVAVFGGSIYAVAGSSGQMENNTAERYDSDAERWTYIASLPAPISNIGVCRLDGGIYCIGGTYGQSGNKHCYRLVDEDTRWERICNLLVGRSQAAVTSFQGKIWVVGGCDAWHPLSTVEIYDPQSNNWKFGPPMNTPRRGCGLVAREDGLLMVVGGSDGTQSLCTTEVYDPRVNLWVAGPNLTSCRVNVSCAVVEGKVWAVGGFSGKMFLNTIECLDMDRDEWTTYVATEKSLEEDRTDSESDKTEDEEVNGNGFENATTTGQHRANPCDN